MYDPTSVLAKPRLCVAIIVSLLANMFPTFFANMKYISCEPTIYISALFQERARLADVCKKEYRIKTYGKASRICTGQHGDKSECGQNSDEKTY